MSEPDPQDKPPPRLMGAVFWIAVLFGLACIGAGAAVGLWGAHLFPAR